MLQFLWRELRSSCSLGGYIFHKADTFHFRGCYPIARGVLSGAGFPRKWNITTLGNGLQRKKHAEVGTHRKGQGTGSARHDKRSVQTSQPPTPLLLPHTGEKRVNEYGYTTVKDIAPKFDSFRKGWGSDKESAGRKTGVQYREESWNGFCHLMWHKIRKFMLRFLLTHRF